MEDNINYAEKIENFKLLVENNNDDIAINYLQRANWDEQKAALLFNNENRTIPQGIPNYNNNNINFMNNNNIDLSKYEECPIVFPSKSLLSGIFSFFTYSYSNFEYVEEFKNLSGYTATYESFINNLRSKIGILFIYNKNNVNLMKSIVKEIKRDSNIKNLLRNKTIFPIFDECDIGVEMLKYIVLPKLPVMLVCKFKNNNAFAIIGKTRPNNFNISSIKETLIKVNDLLNPQNNSNNKESNNYPEDYHFNYMSNGDVINQQKRDLEELERKEREKKEKERQLLEEKKKEEKRLEEEKKRKEEELKKKEEKIKIIKKNLPPDPDDSNPDKCTILFRYPDGNRNVERKFLKNDKISLLYDFIETLGRDIYTENDNNKFELIQTFPFKKYDDLNKTLEEEGLFPNSMLQIKEID